MDEIQTDINAPSMFLSVVLIQSVKILLLPPKCQIIMVLSNYPYFQYFDINIGLYSIAPWKVIALPTLAIAIVVALSFFLIQFLFDITFNSVKERQLWKNYLESNTEKKP